MKKRMLRKLAAFILCTIMLCMGLPAAAETVVQPMQDNSIEFSVKPEYRDEVLADPEGALAGLHPAGVYITGVNKEDGGGIMGILLVLSERGEQARQEAIETLSTDPRVERVHQFNDVPVKEMNTLSLSAEKNTIHVGEKVAIRQEGEVMISEPLYDEYSLQVELKNYDPDKEYTVEDFPQIPLEKVRKFSYDNGENYAFNLVLDREHENYFDFYFELIRAVDVMSRSPDTSYVCLGTLDGGGVADAEFCIVSDASVAQFTNPEVEYFADNALVGRANEDNEYILEGLAPGKVTVTYYIYGKYLGPYTVQTEITVLDNEPPVSDIPDVPDTPDAPQGDSSESNPARPSNPQPDSPQTSESQSDSSQSNNPKTGDVSPIAAAGLFALAGGSGVWIVLRKSKAAKNLYR